MNLRATKDVNINASRECNINAGIGKYKGIEISTVQDDANVLKSANQYTDAAISGIMSHVNETIRQAIDDMGPPPNP